MIKRIYRSKSDIANLSHRKTEQCNQPDGNDYRKQIVKKPWGYEYLSFENTAVAAWVLHIAGNEQTSMHCHPLKKTSLIVLHGRVKCFTLEGFWILTAGDGLVIDASVFHSTQAISSDGAIIMELETPPNKRDLVRLKDAYGREGKGYEGTHHMSFDVQKYVYFDFFDYEAKEHAPVTIGSCKLHLKKELKPKDKTVASSPRHKHLLCLLSGKISDHTGKTILTAGEVIEYSTIVTYLKTDMNEILCLHLRFGEDRLRESAKIKRRNG